MAVMSETGFWQSRQDRDFQNHNPFFETGIETLKTPIPFSRLGLRLSICQSLFRDWDRDFQYANPFFETGIETFKMSITFSRLGSRLINWRGSQCTVSSALQQTPTACSTGQCVLQRPQSCARGRWPDLQTVEAPPYGPV